MPNWVPKFEGNPIVMFKKGEHYDHPTILGASKSINRQYQETKSVGEVRHVFPKPDQKKSWRGVGEILVSKVKEFLRSLDTDQVPMFSSPSVAYTGDDYDIRDGDPMHVALTDDPAFPPEISRITGICEGDESSCLAKLANAKKQNYEAGNDDYVCFAEGMKELVLNNSVMLNKNNNTSLKISNSSKHLSNMENTNSETQTEGQKDQGTQTQTKSPAEISKEIIESQAKDALNKMINEQKQRTANPEKADPKGTFDKAYGINKEESQGEPKKEEAITKEDLDEVKKQLAEQKAINRRNEIAKIIPLRMVTDVKSGGVSESLLTEVVDYWMKTPLEPKDIGEFYAKQESQIEVLNPTPKSAKASFTNQDIASKLANGSTTQFDAPDADNSKENQNEKYANAAYDNDPAWALHFARMLVTPVSEKAQQGKGAPRRMID
jgi:hypothetical protein